MVRSCQWRPTLAKSMLQVTRVPEHYLMGSHHLDDWSAIAQIVSGLFLCARLVRQLTVRVNTSDTLANPATYSGSASVF